MHDGVNLTPFSRPRQVGNVPAGTGWPRPESGATDGTPRERAVAALRRYRWLIAGIVLVGSLAGLAATRFVNPSYQVQATIWISGETPQGRSTGPIRAEELLNVSAWPDLLRSFAILDTVVREEALYLVPKVAAHQGLFVGFALADSFRPGSYELRVDADRRRYALLLATGAPLEGGAVGDSIGRRAGFRWRPDSAALSAAGEIQFDVVTPREAAVELRDRLAISLPQQSNLLRVSLSGTEPAREAATLNTLIRRFVLTAAHLKRRNHMEFAATLQQQVAYAERELRDAEIALEDFRVRTITLPSEGGPVAGGVEATRDPVLASFFALKIQRDDIRFEQQVLERTLAGVRSGELDPVAFSSIPAVQHAAPELRRVLQEYIDRTAALRTTREAFTDEHSKVRELQHTLRTLRERTIPAAATEFLQELAQRASDLDARIGTASSELAVIPTRTIEEMRLRRNVDVRQQLYTMLKNRYEEARLAEASALPDVSVLDSAVAPQQPTSDTRPMVLLLGVLASLGAGIGLALALDRFDGRVHYPAQVSGGLGLDILGAVPTVRKNGKLRRGEEEMAQVVEAFRSIRLGLCHAYGAAGPLVVTVSSPGAGDGKSFVSANLAMSFADAGVRTVLVDGDIRRGALHSTFGLPRTPGLIDVLAGTARLDDATRPTGFERLAFLPCGTRRRSGPELLTSPTLTRMIAELRARYEVIIVDSAPLGAGIDPFVLGAATGHMLLVLRAGTTDRGMAEAKLQLMDRLPVRMLGAVLNDVRAEGAYKYYSYLYGYAWEDDDAREERAVGAGVSAGR